MAVDKEKLSAEQIKLANEVKKIRSGLPVDLIEFLNKGKRFHENKEKNVRGKS
jgi:hypothetical protein